MIICLSLNSLVGKFILYISPSCEGDVKICSTQPNNIPGVCSLRETWFFWVEQMFFMFLLTWWYIVYYAKSKPYLFTPVIHVYKQISLHEGTSEVRLPCYWLHHPCNVAQAIHDDTIEISSWSFCVKERRTLVHCKKDFVRRGIWCFPLPALDKTWYFLSTSIWSSKPNRFCVSKIIHMKYNDTFKPRPWVIKGENIGFLPSISLAAKSLTLL